MGIIWFSDDRPLPAMPQKKTITQGEARELIIKESKYRIGCENFTPTFTLHRLEQPGYATPAPGLAPPITGNSIANWDVQRVQDMASWKPACAAAFQEAVARARRKYDVAWPRLT